MQKLGRIVRYTLICAIVLMSVIPILWVVLTSFKSPKDAMSVPPKIVFTPVLSNYRTVLLGETQKLRALTLQVGITIVRNLINSIIVTVGTVVASVVLASMAAYAIARYPFPGRRIFLTSLILSRLLAPIATVVPIYFIANRFGMLDRHLTLMIVYTAFNLPLCTLMLKTYFEDIPVEVEQAALVDGCSNTKVLFRIVIPLAAPGAVATAVFASILAWNDVVFAMILTSENAVTAPVVALSQITEEGVRFGGLGAVGTILIVPVIIFTSAVQRKLVRGLTMGAIKE
jgi:multiple sugar transport system permease protein